MSNCQKNIKFSTDTWTAPSWMTAPSTTSGKPPTFGPITPSADFIIIKFFLVYKFKSLTPFQTTFDRSTYQMVYKRVEFTKGMHILTYIYGYRLSQVYVAQTF